MAVGDWLKTPATLGVILGVGALTAGLSGSLIRTVADLYDGEVAYADAALGKLFAYLRLRHLYDGSIITVMSDHGESALYLPAAIGNTERSDH